MSAARLRPAAVPLRPARRAARGRRSARRRRGRLLRRHAVRPAAARRCSTRSRPRAPSDGYPTSAGLGRLPRRRRARCCSGATAWTSRPTRLAACVGTKEFVASLASLPRPAGPDARHGAVPGRRVPDLRGLRPARRAARRAGRRSTAGGSRFETLDDDDRRAVARALGELAVQPDGPARRPRRGRGVRAAPRHRRVLGRVLRGLHLGGAAERRSSPTATRACSRCTRLSKRSNLAGVRAGFYAGDPELVDYLGSCASTPGSSWRGPSRRPRRRHGPTTATSTRSASATPRGSRPCAPRSSPRAASVEAPEGSFYLWASRPEVRDGWALAYELAERAGLSPAPASSTARRPTSSSAWPWSSPTSASPSCATGSPRPAERASALGGLGEEQAGRRRVAATGLALDATPSRARQHPGELLDGQVVADGLAAMRRPPRGTPSSGRRARGPGRAGRTRR